MAMGHKLTLVDGHTSQIPRPPMEYSLVSPSMAPNPNFSSHYFKTNVPTKNKKPNVNLRKEEY